MSVHSKITNKKTNDGFNNVYKALGSNRDITTNTTYTRNSFITLNHQMMNGLYANSWGGKAVDIPIEDAFKGGRIFNSEDKAKIEEYEEYLKYLEVDSKLKNAMRWSKIFGSAVAIIISNDDEMSEPLVVDNIKKGDVKDIIVLDRWQLYTMDLNLDTMSSNYLKPKYYYVTKSSTPIHHTRVIRFDGLDTTIHDREYLQGWCLSVYERLYKSIQNAQMSPDLLINLLVQSNLDVYKLENFNETLMNDDSLITQRVQYAQMGKSILNGIILDKEDEYMNISKSFSGLDSIHEKFIDLLCGAVDIPKTRFLNIQSSGLANDGQGDLKFYYDRIESNERAELREAYEYLDAILIKSYFGQDVEIDFEFKSLFQMTPQQEAEIRNKNMTTNTLLIDRGIISEMEVRELLIEDPYYSNITRESLNNEMELESELDKDKNNFEEK